MIDDPLVNVIVYSAAAAAAAVLGVLPSALRREPSLTLFGWANALASGLMLGVAYSLLTDGLDTGLAAGGVAALFGIAFVRATHSLTGTSEPTAASPDGATGGHRIVLAHTLHAAHEGIAIGAAMALSPPLGIATAATLAVHNIPEAMVLTRTLDARGLPRPRIAALAIGSNANQVLLAAGTFVLVGVAPGALPWITGFAVGAFVYLVLVELLPESYHQAGHTSIALVTLAAMGMVVLLGGLV